MSQHTSQKHKYSLLAILDWVVSSWWIYGIYVTTIIILTISTLSIIESSKAYPLMIIKGAIVILATLIALLPPMVNRPKKIHYIFGFGLIIWLLIQDFSLTNYNNILSSISPRFLSGPLKLTFGNILVLLILLLFIIIYKLKLISENLCIKTILTYLSGLLILFTILGIRGFYDERIVSSLAYKFNEKNTKKYFPTLNKNISTHLEYLGSFDELINWVKSNIPISGAFLCLDDTYAQQFKLASQRSGIGSINEVEANASNSFKNKYFEDFIKVEKTLYIKDANYLKLLPGLMKKYRLNYVLLSKWENLLQESEWFTHLFENKHFILFRLNKDNLPPGDYLAVHAMERRSEGPIHVKSMQEQQSYLLYQDLLISPKMKYPKGKYSIHMTASGKPDLPTQMRGTLTISIVKQEEQDLVIGKFELDASPKTFTTKEFALDSEEMFQLSFKKETQLIQTQLLQFDGIDDYVNIQFKTPLDLPEGTLTFWAAPAFSSSEQSSSVSLINFYTINGYKFEFADGLLGTPPERWPYFWFVWRRPDQYAIHINLYNPTFKAGEWIHWAGAWKISQNGNLHMEFYINGELVGQNTVLRNSISSGSLNNIFFDRLEVGLMGKDWHFMGSIADIRLFNKALQPVQFMQNPLKENPPFLVGYWKLLGFCNQTIPDLTKNHNDGTLGHDSSGGSDDPQCVEMQVPFAGDITINWLKNVMIKKLE